MSNKQTETKKGLPWFTKEMWHEAWDMRNEKFYDTIEAVLQKHYGPRKEQDSDMPSDTEMLDWLENHPGLRFGPRGFSFAWLNKDYCTARQAIAAAMKEDQETQSPTH